LETLDSKQLFPALAKPLKLIPNFYGDSRRAEYEKYKNAAKYADALWSAVEKLYQTALSAPLKK
jgi:hypothetical protein